MSQEDNQRQERSAPAGNSIETSEGSGSHRILINEPSSSKNHSRNNSNNPKSPTSPTFRPRRRKSTYNPDDDDDDEEYDSDDSRKRKRKELRKRHSYRRRKSSMPPNVEDDVVDDENRNDGGDEDESDHEFTLKDRQEAINITHPFGLPIWKPALYKKTRSVERNADSALHSIPSPDLYLSPGNIVWAICFGWWLAIISYAVSIILLLTPFGGRKYAIVLQELSSYIFWPFGKFVEKESDYFNNDEQPTDYFSHRGSSAISDMDINNESRPLLGRNNSTHNRSEKFNLFEKLDEIGLSGIVFYFWFFLIIVPIYLLVSAICWFTLFPIPMAKLTYELLGHLRKHPLSLHFKSGSRRTTSSVVLLCTDRAFGFQYYKYTYDGINIMFINLMPIVFFVIIDDRYLKKRFQDYFFATEEFIFALSLASVIPLSYFIGTAVASISAQSSIGMGAVINATFGSIIEIILYGIALNKGKGKLTEGSIIGSLMAGVLLMPGVSMISGGFKRKEQRFNAKSAGVTSTMLIVAIIGALTPTLFFQTYAPYKMSCTPCKGFTELTDECQVCTHVQVDPTSTLLYEERVKPLMFFCASILVFSYLIGLWFTFRTHASLVWQTGHHPHTFVDNMIPQSIFKKFIPSQIQQNLQTNLPHQPLVINTHNGSIISSTPQRPMSAPGPNLNTDEHNIHNLAHVTATLSSQNHQPQIPIRFAHEPEEEEDAVGHDSPNWSKVKSGIVLVSCTALYSIIAEILVQNVEVVLDNVTITEKFLGLTLFALVPSVTEFVNAMSFALNGNIALSMEIGSAYALQVCLLQIPSMVAFSAWYNNKSDGRDNSNSTFTLVFPRWDVFSVVFSVFLLTYTYIEGKSNYFKGSILILSYLVLMAGFFYAPDDADNNY